MSVTLPPRKQGFIGFVAPGPVDPEVYAIQQRELRDPPKRHHPPVVVVPVDRKYVGTRREASMVAVNSGNIELLAALLHDAEAAHARYEADGSRADDWPLWYAEWLLGVR